MKNKRNGVVFVQITLADAVSLKSLLGKRIHELLSERESVSTVVYKVGDSIPESYDERSMEEVTVELNDVRSDVRNLSLIVAKKNLETFIDWSGSQIPLTSALELSKQLRGEVNDLKGFGKRKKEGLQTGWGSEDNKVLCLYEPREYKELGSKLERQVNKLSSDINNKNYNTLIEFPEASKYF